jgi:hypothetical protein
LRFYISSQGEPPASRPTGGQFAEEEVPSTVLADEDLVTVLTGETFTTGLGGGGFAYEVGVFERPSPGGAVALFIFLDAVQHGAADALEAGVVRGGGHAAKGYAVVCRVCADG